MNDCKTNCKDCKEQCPHYAKMTLEHCLHKSYDTGSFIEEINAIMEKDASLPAIFLFLLIQYEEQTRLIAEINRNIGIAVDEGYQVEEAISRTFKLIAEARRPDELS